MSTAIPISDPVGEKKPDKSYAWWIENIDHKITPEVSNHIIAISSTYTVVVSHTQALRSAIP
jgi:hypothetical protein